MQPPKDRTPKAGGGGRKFFFLLLFIMCIAPAVLADNITVTGTILSASDDEPLIGAWVKVTGTANGVNTDIDGNFTLPNVPEGAELETGYIGFTSQKFTASTTPVEIKLKENSEVLEEVVVVGYGVQKKKLVTGATSQVKGETLAKMNTTNPLQAMQGQTSGVNISQTTGQPGKSMKVSIRGLGTVGNSEPLYLIDGVGGDINTVNPADIESIDVLKDAASAAIYGAQAANGVVLVTTKSGKEGKTTVSFDGYYGWQSKPRSVDMLNASQYMMIMDEQAVNSGNAPYDWSSYKSIYDADGNLYNTDWLDTLWKDNAEIQSYTLGITGGTAKNNFAISLGYLSNEGIVGGKQVSNYSRYNFRVNSNYKFFDDLFTVGEQVSFVHYKTRNMNDEGNGNNGNRIYPAFNASPLAPVYSDQGQYGSPYNSTLYSDWHAADGNPYGQMMTLSQQKNRASLFNGNVYLQIDPIKGLTIKTLLGVSYSWNNYRSFTPQYQFDAYTNGDKTYVSQSASDGYTITWQNTASYNFSIERNNFNALIGMETSRTDGFNVAAGQASLSSGFDNWSKAYVDNGTATSSDNGLSASGSPWTSIRNLSYFARLGWDYDARYMINFTLRADGSSKFAKGHRWGWFPSVSAGWNISNESFMESTRSWLNNLKLRASWGRVGNNNVDSFQYLAQVVYGGHYTFGSVNGSSSDGYVIGAYPSSLENENIKWETSEQFDVGIDAYFLNSRLQATVDYYSKTTKDWLVWAPLLSTSGFTSQLINGGDVKNKGVEVSLTWNDRIGNVSYNVVGNFAYNHNRVGSIPTEDGIIHGATGVLYDNAEEFYRAENGHSIGYFWGYKTAGIFQNQQEIDDWIAAGNGVYQSNVQPGDVKYVDQNHDGVIDENDKVDLGSGVPKWTFGFNLGATWKHFDLGVVLSGMAGHKIVQSYRNIADKQANYTTRILNRWTGEGTSTTLPRVTEGTDNWAFSDLYVQDGDFLRITNVTLGYDFAHLINKKWCQQCRLYFQIQNLYTFTHYDGLDPEVGTGTSSDSWVSGVDQGFYPRPRTFLFGVNLTF